MALDLEIVAKIVSPILVAIVGALLKKYLEAKPRLVFYLVHSSAHPLPNQENPSISNSVHTHSIVVRNEGKMAAKNVRIGHFFLPASFQIYPPLTYSLEKGQGESAEIVFPTLVQNEQVSISYLYFPPLLWNQIHAYVKSDEGLAKGINIIPTSPPSKLIVALLYLFIFVGASTCTYWLFKLVMYLVQ